MYTAAFITQQLLAGLIISTWLHLFVVPFSGLLKIWKHKYVIQYEQQHNAAHLILWHLYQITRQTLTMWTTVKMIRRPVKVFSHNMLWNEAAIDCCVLTVRIFHTTTGSLAPFQVQNASAESFILRFVPSLSGGLPYASRVLIVCCRIHSQRCRKYISLCQPDLTSRWSISEQPPYFSESDIFSLPVLTLPSK